MYENEIKRMKRYIEDLKELYKTNPELAKKIAKERLQNAGILGGDGELYSPYNGKKVHKDDFTRGPMKIYYEEDER